MNIAIGIIIMFGTYLTKNISIISSILAVSFADTAIAPISRVGYFSYCICESPHN
ncbi:hypothetical protein [Candidatus Coxiella mudrowiae]|uniref:hypothetical protein n=1 Tax=Candidatus Coxiella mudrowiae TaxID=2054173 RepID=UPI0012FF2AFF|nr:hypothetical protein [Candidatus Coxiella mudrowiae]